MKVDPLCCGQVEAEDAEEGFGAANDADVYSDTSSLAALSQVSSKRQQQAARNANSIQTRMSAGSRGSRKSSKNRRKHERKMYSTKAS